MKWGTANLIMLRDEDFWNGKLLARTDARSPTRASLSWSRRTNVIFRPKTLTHNQNAPLRISDDARWRQKTQPLGSAARSSWSHRQNQRRFQIHGLEVAKNFTSNRRPKKSKVLCPTLPVIGRVRWREPIYAVLAADAPATRRKMKVAAQARALLSAFLRRRTKCANASETSNKAWWAPVATSVVPVAGATGDWQFARDWYAEKCTGTGQCGAELRAKARSFVAECGATWKGKMLWIAAEPIQAKFL